MDLILAIFKSLFISVPIMMIWVAIRIKYKEWRSK